MATVDRSYTTCYVHVIVTINIVPFSSYLAFNNIATLKSIAKRSRMITGNGIIR